MQIGDLNAKIVTLKGYDPDNPSEEVKTQITEFENDEKATEAEVKRLTQEISKKKLACFSQSQKKTPDKKTGKKKDEKKGEKKDESKDKSKDEPSEDCQQY